LILLAWLAGIMGLLAYAVAWLFHLASVGSSGVLGALLSAIDRDLPLSPFSALLDLAKTYAVQACAALVMAWCFDWLVRKWWKLGPSRWMRFFNVAAHVTVPLAVFAIVPVAGMLVAAVFACYMLYLLAVRLYAPGDWMRTLGSLILSCIPAALSAMLLGLVLGFVISPIEAMDPFDAMQRHFAQARAEKDMAQAQAPAAAVPTPAATEPVIQTAQREEPAAQIEAKPAVPVKQAQPSAPAQLAEQAAAQAAPSPQPTVAPTAQPMSAAEKIQNVNNAVDAARKISSFFH
jgi:hypothetical protein